MKATYHYPIFVGVLHVESLLRYLLEIAHACLLDQAELARAEHDKFQALMKEAHDILRLLITNYRRHMDPGRRLRTLYTILYDHAHT